MARHVEVQVVGDGQGGVAVLGDRDCSVQRRNQKVVEEAPAPALPGTLRAGLAESARLLAASVGYRSVGTVEFLVDPAPRRVLLPRGEHPPAGRARCDRGWSPALDLVEAMLRVAAGDTSVVAAARPGRCTATRSRPALYAEDPAQGFLPSAGLLTEVAFPPGVRVDTWVETGTEVTPHYDPLLAKVVAAGDDAGQARSRRWRDALDGTRLAGIETNREWVRGRRCATALSAAADHSTGLYEATAVPAADRRGRRRAPGW